MHPNILNSGASTVDIRVHPLLIVRHMTQVGERSENQEEVQAHQTGSDKKRIKRLRIVVTQKEIDEARREKSDGCMIEASLKRDHPEFTRTWVDKNFVRFTDPKANVIYTFELTPRGRVMLLKWDAGEEVKPFEIWLLRPTIREREFSGGKMAAKHNYHTALRHRGVVPNPKTKQARIETGKDRAFGRKQWTAELAHLRAVLGLVPTDSATAEKA